MSLNIFAPELYNLQLRHGSFWQQYITCGDDYMYTTTVLQTVLLFFSPSTSLTTSSIVAFYVLIPKLFRVTSTDFMDFHSRYQ